MKNLGRDSSYQTYFAKDGNLFVGSVSWEAEKVDIDETLTELKRCLQINQEWAENTKNQDYAHYLTSAYSLYSGRAEQYERLIKNIENEFKAEVAA